MYLYNWLHIYYLSLLVTLPDCCIQCIFIWQYLQFSIFRQKEQWYHMGFERVITFIMQINYLNFIQLIWGTSNFKKAHSSSYSVPEGHTRIFFQMDPWIVETSSTAWCIRWSIGWLDIRWNSWWIGFLLADGFHRLPFDYSRIMHRLILCLRNLHRAPMERRNRTRRTRARRAQRKNRSFLRTHPTEISRLPPRPPSLSLPSRPRWGLQRHSCIGGCPQMFLNVLEI